LVISSPVNGSVGYVRIPPHGGFTGKEKVRPLITEGLLNPQGIAIDQKRQQLFVADPDLRQVFLYQLACHGHTLEVTSATPQVVVDAEVRWIALDGLGSVYMTSEADSRLLRLHYQQLLIGDTNPEELYGIDIGHAISAPGGIATDNFNLFWSNKADGQQKGVVWRAPVYAGAGTLETQLARNIPKSYGICVANDHVYYAAEANSVYAIKRDGGLPVLVGSTFSSPRGCVWDGDGTVYVADRTENAVFSFAGPEIHPEPGQPIKRAVHVEGAFGLAVLSVQSEMNQHPDMPQAV